MLANKEKRYCKNWLFLLLSCTNNMDLFIYESCFDTAGALLRKSIQTGYPKVDRGGSFYFPM